MPGIVVGVDGSEHTRPVLEWAAREAGLRNTSLTVITVWQVAGNHWTGHAEVYPSDQAETEKMRQAAEAATQKAVDAAGSAPASVTVRAVSGIAAQELISASNDADLVVVGSRGGGGFARLMMGSTSNQVVAHSAAPVAVVPVAR